MEQTERVVVFGRPEGTNDTAVRIAYEATNGEQRVYVPKQAIQSRIICADSERTAYTMQQCEIDGNVFDPAFVFSGELSPLPPTNSNDIEFVDAVEQGVQEANLRHLVKEQKESNEAKATGIQQATQGLNSGVVNAPPSVAPPSVAPPSVAPPQVAPPIVEDIDDEGEQPTLVLDEENIASGYTPETGNEGIVTASGSPPPTVVDIDSDENDDSVPVFAPTPAHIPGVVETDVKGESSKIVDSAWGGALLAGGRDRAVVPWRFTPQKVPGYIMVQADEESGVTPVKVVDKNGKPTAYHIMNPELATEKMPGGACLGTVSDSYCLLPHTTVFDPIMKYADQHDLKTHVTSYNQGAKARLDIDVSQAAQSRKIAADRNKAAGHKWLDTSAFGNMIDKLDGIYKYGFAIHNSVDGSGALSVQAQALRVYCNNLASMGGIDTVLRMRHKNGVMADMDWDKFGETIVDATAEIQQWLVNQELMAHLPLDVQLFDKLTVAADKLNILTLPTVKMDENKNATFQRGHLWRVVGSGFVNPATGSSGHDQPFVKVALEQKGTVYHAMQSFTGALTHKPEWTSADGKQKMAGNSLSIDGTTKKLQQTNSLFMGICNSAYEAYMEATGATEIGEADLPKVAQFIQENTVYDTVKLLDNGQPNPKYGQIISSPLKVGLGKNQMKALHEIPTVEETLLLA